jgi:hypothetical protein
MPKKFYEIAGLKFLFSQTADRRYYYRYMCTWQQLLITERNSVEK